MAGFKICAQYNQLFSSSEKRFCRSGRKSLDDAVKDVNALVSTLEEIAANVPLKEKIAVESNNGEIEIIYEADIQDLASLTGPKDVLKYFLTLPDKYRPQRIHVFADSQEQCREIETFLNQYGKTMRYSKAKDINLSIFKPLVMLFSQPFGYGTYIRDAK